MTPDRISSMTDVNAPRSKWFSLVWVIPALLVAAIAAVLVARWLRELPEVASFIADYPGTTELPDGAPIGIPIWANWSHFLNSFFLLFVFRTAWQLRSKKRPSAFWTRDNTRWPRTKGAPVRIGLPTWVHLSFDALWVLNGLVFAVLLFSTGQWMRLVPLSWEVIPNAVSAGIQYVSLVWPVENGWVNYNSLQLITYFITVFIAGPLALLTGLRIAPGFAAHTKRFDRVFPRKLAVTIHVGVFFWFIGFTIVHVFLVLATGALRNLNHMYAGHDGDGWLGAILFASSLVLMAITWFALKPSVLALIAEKSGTVRRMPGA
jgi:thiosulfate reductase cytochrome b subunit